MRAESFRAFWATGLFCAALLLSSCGSDPATGAEQSGTEGEEETAAVEMLAVSAGPVRRQTLSEVYTTSTTLRAEKRAAVTARTRGVIVLLKVEEGDSVHTGELLAVLEDDEQTIRNNKAADALSTLKRELSRSDSLLEQGMLSVEGHEELRQQVEAARHEASLAELELSRTRIRAPFAGIVLSRFLDAGSVVADGTEVYEIADLKPLYADVQIPARHVARVAPGQEVRLDSESGDVQILAEIERIAPKVDTTTGTVKVTIAVSDEESIRPGTFVRVSIVTGSREGALVVPRSAMVAEGRRWNIFRLIEGDKVEVLGVEPGFEEGDMVEILRLTGEGTLHENDSVIVTGASALSDGDTVQVLPARPSGDAGVTS